MKRLYEADRGRLFEYVGREPEMNLFFVGDVENYGLESEIVSAYALPDGDDWDCVLLQYFDMYLIYSQREKLQAGKVAEFLRDRRVDSLSGKTELVRQLQPYYPQLELKETYMCRCGMAQIRRLSPGDDPEKEPCPGRIWEKEASDVELRPVAAEECPELVRLYMEIEEFSLAKEGPEKAQKTLEADFARGELAVGVYENGVLAAIARTSGSGSSGAMLVGVATRPGFRKKGYATAAVTELCRRSFLAGKQFLCLFYDNPEAGRIYRRIGFEEIGFYAMLK